VCSAAAPRPQPTTRRLTDGAPDERAPHRAAAVEREATTHSVEAQYGEP
jgi:hypothetical protein